MLKTVVSKSICHTAPGLAAAAVLTIFAGAYAHAQSTDVASEAAPGASISSSSTSASSDSVQAPDAALAPVPQTTPANDRRWGLNFSQPAASGKGYFHTHGFDLAGSGTGRYQTSVTHQSPALAGNTEGVGFLANIREHPTSWFGLELNYGYNRYTEHYRVTPAGGPVNYVQLDQHEATAGYVFHVRTPWVQPFIVLGGGGVNFRGTRSNPQFGNQWRGAAMYEVGLDFVPKQQPHVGFRIQEHGLFYKAPDFYVANFRSNSWVPQALPAVGVFYRF